MPIAVTLPVLARRDVFAAHAPAAPDWFYPTMPDPPVTPAMPDALKPHEASVRAFYLGDCELTDLAEAVRPLAQAWNNAMVGWEHENDRWCDERRRQKYAQWPWVYADLVLAAEWSAKEAGVA